MTMTVPNAKATTGETIMKRTKSKKPTPSRRSVAAAVSHSRGATRHEQAKERAQNRVEQSPGLMNEERRKHQRLASRR